MVRDGASHRAGGPSLGRKWRDRVPGKRPPRVHAGRERSVRDPDECLDDGDSAVIPRPDPSCRPILPGEGSPCATVAPEEAVVLRRTPDRVGRYARPDLSSLTVERRPVGPVRSEPYRALPRVVSVYRPESQATQRRGRSESCQTQWSVAASDRIVPPGKVQLDSRYHAFTTRVGARRWMSAWADPKNST